jgi:hypothetical protein
MPLLIFIVSLSFLSACQSAPLQLRKGELDSGRIYVPCTFDDVSTTCFLDTGSTNAIIADRSEFDLYDVVGKIKYKSASGISKEMSEVQIKQAIIGGIKIKNLNVGLVKDAADSVVGINEISSVPFALKFKARPQIIFNPNFKNKRQLPLDVLDKNILSIPIKVQSEAASALFDTGAGLSVVNKDFVERNPRMFDLIQDISNGTDATGNPVTMKLHRIKRIEIGDFVFENENILSMDFETVRKHISPTIDFIIGFNLITKADWYFDLKAKTWSNE